MKIPRSPPLRGFWASLLVFALVCGARSPRLSSSFPRDLSLGEVGSVPSGAQTPHVDSGRAVSSGSPVIVACRIWDLGASLWGLPGSQRVRGEGLYTE